MQPFVVEANRKELEESAWIDSPLAGTDDWYVLSDKTAYDLLYGLRLDQEIPIV